MWNRTCTSLAFVFAFCAASLIQLTATYADFEPEVGWDGHLFPSYIIATATMKAPEKAESEVDDDDEDNEAVADDDDDDDDIPKVLGDPIGLLGVTLKSKAADQKVKVTITCDALLEPSIFTCTLPDANETYTVNPKIKYKFDQLAKRAQTGPVSISFAVEIDDEEPEERTETATLRSVNDCPFLYVKNDKQYDVSFMFATYVNEQHPFVDKVLREALDSKIVSAFTGYQSKDSKEVYKQAYALWHALSKRDVRYSSITTSVAESGNVASQHVRMIDESINNRQANCVDGSVLLASLLRKVGIEPILILVPGHCYVAFFLDEERKTLSALETTIIGSDIQGEAVSIKDLAGVVSNDRKNDSSWKTFSAAIATGVKNYSENAAKFDVEKGDHQRISVVDARKLGILPIGFQGNQKFIEAPASETKKN